MEEHCSYHPDQVAVCRKDRIFICDPPEVFLCAECLKNFNLYGSSCNYKRGRTTMKAIKVLEALNLGIKVKLFDFDCLLHEDSDGKTITVCNAKKESFQEGKKIIGETSLPIEFTLGEFIDECENISQEEWSLLIMNLALSKAKIERKIR